MIFPDTRTTWHEKHCLSGLRKAAIQQSLYLKANTASLGYAITSIYNYWCVNSATNMHLRQAKGSELQKGRKCGRKQTTDDSQIGRSINTLTYMEKGKCPIIDRYPNQWYLIQDDTCHHKRERKVPSCKLRPQMIADPFSTSCFMKDQSQSQHSPVIHIGHLRLTSCSRGVLAQNQHGTAVLCCLLCITHL